MNRKFHTATMFALTTMLGFSTVLPYSAAQTSAAEPSQKTLQDTVKHSSGAKEVQFLFTHDLHSHLDSFSIERDGATIPVGGFARLKTLVDEKRQQQPATFLVDGGDFSMGTLYQTIYETEAPELTMMGMVGYDATTFGNHEFDYRSEGISNMLRAAVAHAKKDPSVQLPALVSANIDWEKNASKENQLIKAAMEFYGSSPYTIVERDGVRVGLYGVLGKDAEACAPESGLVFEDIVETSKKVVKELKQEHVDLIVCLSHSGTFEDKKQSEDEILAKEVPDIDLIISGHTHTTLNKPIQYGDTYVVSAGSYGERLGEIDLVQKDDGRWTLENYQLNLLDASVAEDPAILKQLSTYKKAVDTEYLSRFDYTFDQVLAENPYQFTQMKDFARTLGEDPLGSLIADAYVYAVQKAEGDHYQKVDVAIAPAGTIRETFQKGALTVSDAFNVSSLGIGADRIPGYPLVSVYLTGKELKTVAEIDVSISPIMRTAQLYPSGICWSYHPSRLLLNRVTDVKLVQNVPYTECKEATALEDDKLYRVVAGLYSAQMLGAIEGKSMGLLDITPKDAAGVPITNYERHIVHDQRGTEVKEWYALASYLDSFEENEAGVSVIPAHYEKPEGRKARLESRNFFDLIRRPNTFAWIFYGVALTLLLFIIGGIRLLRNLYRRRKKLE